MSCSKTRTRPASISRSGIPRSGPQPTPADLATIVASPAFVTWITPAATQARIDALQPERTTLRAQAVQAVADCETFLALAAPTTPQVLAAVRRLCQIAEALIKYAAVQP